LDDRIRLSEIEGELDKAAQWEDPPYRYARTKLVREKRRILERLAGEDPLSAIDDLKPYQTKYQDLTDAQKERYRIHKHVSAILDELDRNRGWEELAKKRGWQW
jgi:hypothetical protein